MHFLDNPENQELAYKAVEHSRSLGPLQKQILLFLIKAARVGVVEVGATDLKIAINKAADSTSYRPAINSLCKNGYLIKTPVNKRFRYFICEDKLQTLIAVYTTIMAQ